MSVLERKLESKSERNFDLLPLRIRVSLYTHTLFYSVLHLFSTEYIKLALCFTRIEQVPKR